MKVLSINQDPIVNIAVSSFFNVIVALFVVDSLEDVVDMVMHCSHSFEAFFCSRRGEFVVLIQVYGTWITAIETSVGRDLVCTGGYGIIGKFCER